MARRFYRRKDAVGCLISGVGQPPSARFYFAVMIFISQARRASSYIFSEHANAALLEKTSTMLIFQARHLM